MQIFYGFQLLLSDSDNKILKPIISNLQLKHCNLPGFTPHLSIYGDYIDLDRAIEVVEETTKNMTQFTVHFEKFDYEERWSRILYIKIKQNEKLITLHENIKSMISPDNDKPFIPHISLMYKDELSEGERAKIISSIKIPSIYTISSIIILRSENGDEDWKEYTKWQVEYSKKFHKP